MRFILVGKVVDEWLDVRAGDLARLFGEALPRWAVPRFAAELRREERWAGIIDAASKKKRSAASTVSCAL